MPQLAMILCPFFNCGQFFDNSAKPLAGGLLHAYESGSSTTQKNTYTTGSGSITNPNPMVLDSSGRLTTTIWLDPISQYNFVLTNSVGTVLGSVDGVSGIMSDEYLLDRLNNFHIAHADTADTVPWTGVTGRPTLLSQFTNNLAGINIPVTSVAGKTGAVTLVQADVSGTAPINNAAFTGTFTVNAAAPIMDTGKDLATNGYQKFSSGLVLQWGSFTGTAGFQTITFPVPFGIACFNVNATCANSSAVLSVHNLTTSSVQMQNASGVCYYIAIGA